METVAYCLKASYVDKDGNVKIGYIAEPTYFNESSVHHVSIIDEFYPYKVAFFSEEKFAKIRAPQIKEALWKYYPNIFSISIHEVIIK